MVKGRDHSSTIYTVDVRENGVFEDRGAVQVTAENKREYWRNTLLPEVSVNSDATVVQSRLTRLSARE